MEIERKSAQLILSLSNKEIFELMGGETIKGKGWPHPDSGIEIAPLGVLRRDESGKYRYSQDQFHKASTTPLEGVLEENTIRVFVPDIVLSDANVDYRTIPLSQFETQLTPEEIQKILPPRGIRINLGDNVINNNRRNGH